MPRKINSLISRPITHEASSIVSPAAAGNKTHGDDKRSSFPMPVDFAITPLPAKSLIGLQQHEGDFGFSLGLAHVYHLDAEPVFMDFALVDQPLHDDLGAMLG